ncbi:MAG: WD40/YVTN/BNR-like repeat-containing protein, partial [Thermoplasmata archaeon]
MDPANSAVVYVSTAGGGVFKSTNGGDTWQETGLRYYSEIRSLAIDPVRTSTLYAGGVGTISKSNDGGDTWTRILTLPRPFRDLALDPELPDTVYVNTDTAIFKTNDGGISWSMFHHQLPSDTYFWSLAVAPSPARALYIAASSGIFRCDLPEGNCNQVSTTLCLRIEFSPGRPGEIFAGTTDAGVLRSRDNGATW